MLCCLMMCLSYVLSSAFWWSLRFPHKNGVLSVFISCCLYDGLCLIYIISVCLRIVVSNTCCGVFFVLFVLILWFVYPMLPVSLDCSFLITPSVFSDVYLYQIRFMFLNGYKTKRDISEKAPIPISDSR